MTIPTGLIALAAYGVILLVAVPGLGNWRQHTWRRRGLVLYGLFALVALAFIPWLDYWNLIGARW